jgi:hypothetical protein
MSTELVEAVASLRRRREELVDQVNKLDGAINILQGLIADMEDPRNFTFSSQSMSVYRKVVSLAEEQPRSWTASQIQATWEARGDPIQGSNPRAALRTALSDAVKRRDLDRMREGQYAAKKWMDLGAAVHLVPDEEWAAERDEKPQSLIAESGDKSSSKRPS